MQMDRGTKQTRLSRTRRAKAVTAIELIVVATLLGITATVAISSGANTAAMRANEVACRIQSDLGYAQSQAILLRKPTSLVFDATQGLYYLARAQTSTTPLTDPLSKKDYRIFFSKACDTSTLKNVARIESYSDASLAGVSFDGSTTLTYNAMGLPVVGSSSAAMVSGKVTITVGSEALAVVVDPVTGYATVQTSAGTGTSGLRSWLLSGLGI